MIKEGYVKYGSRSNRPQTKSDPSQIGPRSNRPQSNRFQVVPAPSRFGLKLNTFELKYTSVYHFKMFLIDFN